MIGVDTRPLSTPFHRTKLRRVEVSTDEPLSVYTQFYTPVDRKNPMKSAAFFIVYGVYTIVYNIGRKCKNRVYRGECAQVWTPVVRGAA